MLGDIKKELLKNPDKIKEVLEHFGYCNVINHGGKYLSFGRDEASSKKSIVIRLEDNDFLWVKDYARNTNKDLFAFISDQRKVEFKEVLNVVKNKLNITDYYEFFNSGGIFGGFYEKIRKKKIANVKTYDDSVLDNYKKCGNLRFLKDNISLIAQKKFNIGYDVESQGIVIPIYDQLGRIMGVKCRVNDDDCEMKYFYLLPCLMTQTLYGYSQNYKYLVNNTILIFESEKSCMQCYSYGIRNCVALGSGSISSKQIQMLLECSPKEIIFMHDTDYDIGNILTNVNKVKSYSRFNEIKIGYWNWQKSIYKNYKKTSPSDLGKNVLEKILKDEIEYIGDDI